MSQNQNQQSNQNGSAKGYRPDAEVLPRANRRRFSAAEKQRILEAAEASCRYR